MDILKSFDGFQLRGHTEVEININGKTDNYCVPWLITGDQDKIVFSIYDYKEEISFDALVRIANDNKTVRDACERYVVNSAYKFLNSNANCFIKADAQEAR